MFGIGGWEFILIAVLALLLFGPDKLPQFARTIGRFMRDFKRYQDLMESTIRAEMFAADPSLRKDAFENAKEFRKKMATGGFTTSERDSSAEEQAEEPAEEEPIDIITGKPGPSPNEEPDEELLTDADEAPAAPDEQSADAGEPASSAEGEGEREEA